MWITPTTCSAMASYASVLNYSLSALGVAQFAQVLSKKQEKEASEAGAGGMRDKIWSSKCARRHLQILVF